MITLHDDVKVFNDSRSKLSAMKIAMSFERGSILDKECFNWLNLSLFLPAIAHENFVLFAP